MLWAQDDSCPGDLSNLIGPGQHPEVDYLYAAEGQDYQVPTCSDAGKPHDSKCHSRERGGKSREEAGRVLLAHRASAHSGVHPGKKQAGFYSGILPSPPPPRVSFLLIERVRTVGRHGCESEGSVCPLESLEWPA